MTERESDKKDDVLNRKYGSFGITWLDAAVEFAEETVDNGPTTVISAECAEAVAQVILALVAERKARSAIDACPGATNTVFQAKGCQHPSARSSTLPRCSCGFPEKPCSRTQTDCVMVANQAGDLTEHVQNLTSPHNACMFRVDCLAAVRALVRAQPSARVPTWAEEELKDGDRICEAAGVRRTEGGRLPVAKIINKLRGRCECGIAAQGQCCCGSAPTDGTAKP